MIQVEDLTKRFGRKTVVDGLWFTAKPGRVTGFLGPNGAGKSTTMRMVLGLDHPTAGRARVMGSEYSSLDRPLTRIGALLDAKATHPNVTARNHLRALAVANGIPDSRVSDTLAKVGLGSAADEKTKGFSLGMAQRLGVAAALLGDPEVLLFDEPVNGLDPEGVLWIRELMKGLAVEGRTVLVSSHLMNEMAVTADHLIVLVRGRLLADTSMQSFIDEHSTGEVIARVSEPERFAAVLAGQGIGASRLADGSLQVSGADRRQIGRIASENHIIVDELTSTSTTLEEAFIRLTHEHLEYAAESEPGLLSGFGMRPGSKRSSACVDSTREGSVR